MPENPIVTRLRRYKEGKKLSLAALARQLDVSVHSIKAWLYRRPPGKTMRRMLSYWLQSKGY